MTNNPPTSEEKSEHAALKESIVMFSRIVPLMTNNEAKLGAEIALLLARIQDKAFDVYAKDTSLSDLTMDIHGYCSDIAGLMRYRPRHGEDQ